MTTRPGWVPSDGPTNDINPVDPRAEHATQTGMCDVAAYADNGAVRTAEGGLVTREKWGN